MKKLAGLLTPGQRLAAFGSAMFPAAVLAGVLARWNVRKRAFDDIPTTEASVRALARKHLKGSIELRAIEGLGNASYRLDESEEGIKKHVITYDPRVNMSVIAHEIGHGLKPIPQIPLASLIAPTMMSLGAFNIGAAAGFGRPIKGRDMALAGLGAALYAPTLLSEYKATSQAKKILGTQPQGLGSAYLTYTLAPAFAAASGLGAYGLSKHMRKAGAVTAMTNSEAYLAGFLEKCAIAGFDPDTLLRTVAPGRWTPNIDATADQGTKPVPIPEEQGSFGTPGTPIQNRANITSARNTLQNATPKTNLNSNMFSKAKPAVTAGSTAGLVAQAAAAPTQPNAKEIPGSSIGLPQASPTANSGVRATGPNFAGAAPKKPPIATPNVAGGSGGISGAVQSLQNQTKSLPSAGGLWQTAAGRAVHNIGGSILNSSTIAR